MSAVFCLLLLFINLKDFTHDEIFEKRGPLLLVSNWSTIDSEFKAYGLLAIVLESSGTKIGSKHDLSYSCFSSSG